MDTNRILSASLLDIVFDNRNKAYGAYELRATYARRIKKSLMITFGLFTLVIGGAVWASQLTKTAIQKEDEVEVTLHEIKDEIPIPPPEETPPPQQQEQTRTVAYVVPEFADVVEDPPPTQDVIDVAAIGTKDIEGEIDNRPTDIEIPGNNTGIIDVPKPKDPDEILSIVEVPAKFNGNWIRFLTKYLNPQVPVDNSAPAGRYTVIVKFVVDKEGNVSDIVPLTNLGYGMEDEAVRVLRKAEKWEPAIQNGFKVKAYHVQHITFEVIGDE